MCACVCARVYVCECVCVCARALYSKCYAEIALVAVMLLINAQGFLLLFLSLGFPQKSAASSLENTISLML